MFHNNGMGNNCGSKWFGYFQGKEIFIWINQLHISDSPLFQLCRSVSSKILDGCIHTLTNSKLDSTYLQQLAMSEFFYVFGVHLFHGLLQWCVGLEGLVVVHSHWKVQSCPVLSSFEHFKDIMEALYFTNSLHPPYVDWFVMCDK